MSKVQTHQLKYRDYQTGFIKKRSFYVLPTSKRPKKKKLYHANSNMNKIEVTTLIDKMTSEQGLLPR